MEPETRSECPVCHRVALLRQARKPVTRRTDRHQDSGPQIPPLASAFFTALGPVRRIVIAVGILVALVGILTLKTPDLIPTKKPVKGRSNLDIAKRELAVLQIALTQFTSDCGRAPTDEEGLLALLNNPGLFGWQRSYVTLLKPDPWENWYVYRSTSSNSWEIFSIGPDDMEGTQDDVHAVDPVSPPTETNGPAL